MDYKSTLNLPRTDFPMKADLAVREPQRLTRWQTARLYEQIQAARTGAPKFILHDGPPFANGDLHIGHVQNKTLKDIVVRYQTLRGRHVPFVPGWDCHGLPIEFKVTQEMRKHGQPAADAATIRRACEAYARKYVDLQRDQTRRLGALGDWDHPYLTLDKAYEAEELRLFASLVEQGYVYRGKKPVYWSIPCRTALAEAEVEYQDHVSQSVYVKFPVIDRPGVFVLIWTTTPWTLPANLAVAYNSTFSYSLVLVGEESYIVSALLLSAIAQKCGWENYQIIRSLQAEHLEQIEFQHPFCERTGRLFPGDAFVDNATGTGFVHIAPGHGLEDYGLGKAQGLPIYSPVDDDGRFIHTEDLPAAQQMPAELLGKAILAKHGQSEANEAVLTLLRSRQMLVHQEDYTHSYPHCWRSKTPVIFRAMDQWFIEIDHATDPAAPAATFRERALREIDRVQWVPDWGKSRIEAAVKARPDWCISRQRTWGVPIPAFYDANGRPILDARIVRNTADLVEREGSNIWFEQSAAELWATVKPQDWAGPEPVAKSSDTLDVWIDSGSSSRCVIQCQPLLHPSVFPGQEPLPPWQADLYLEGSDQHRGWFQSSLLLSLAGNGSAPFRTVLTHGFVVNPERAKFSKSSQGSYQKPPTVENFVKEYGADVLRLWVASQNFRSDVVFTEDHLKKVGETYRVIRNALRYQLSNLYDFDPAHHTVPDAELTGLDRWILGEFAHLEREVIRAYDQFEFHVVYQKLSQFAAVELSAIYHDLVKDRLYTDAAGSRRRRSTQTALHQLVSGLCRMLAPLMPFTADEAWDLIPGRPCDSVHLALWEPARWEVSDQEAVRWQKLFALRAQALPELEKARQAKQIGKALEARLVLAGRGDWLAVAREHAAALREILNVSQLEVLETDTEGAVVTVEKAAGSKCERCWHWESDVGSHAGHPTLCGRCVETVNTSRTP